MQVEILVITGEGPQLVMSSQLNVVPQKGDTINVESGDAQLALVVNDRTWNFRSSPDGGMTVLLQISTFMVNLLTREEVDGARDRAKVG